MGWLLHLADGPLAGVSFLEGEPLLVAVWYSPDECEFFAVADGTSAGRLVIDPPVGPRDGSSWRDFVATLQAPNKAYLPRVTTPRETIYTSYDGRLRLYHQTEPPFLRLEDGAHSVALVNDTHSVSTVGFDRELGAVVALLANGSLSFFQQTIAVAHGQPDAGELPPDSFLSVADAGALVVLGSGVGMRVFDFAGNERAANAHESLTGVCAATGHLIAAVSASGNTLRIYDDRLVLLAEEQVSALLSRQEPLQLVHAMPDDRTGVHAIDLTHDGILALGIGGYLSVLTVNDLTPVPQDQPLL